MITRDEIIEIGAFNKPHGINGEISATFDYDIDVISGLECFITSVNGIFVPFFAESIRAKNNSTALIKFDGLDDDKSVKFLVNQNIYVQKSVFSPAQIDVDANSDELPLDFFIGFTIKTSEDDTIGEITAVDCATENYLFIVNENIYIPATDDFILDIDFDHKVLEMDLPEGIFDLNNN